MWPTRVAGVILTVLINACFSNILLILVNFSYVVERGKTRMRTTRLPMVGFLDHLVVMADPGLVPVVGPA